MRGFKALQKLGLGIQLFLVLLWSVLAQATKTPGESPPDVHLKEFRLDELKQTINTFRPGADHDYFAGMVANRTNKTIASIQLLQRALASRPPLHRNRAAIAKVALADDFRKEYRYSDALRIEDDLAAHYADQLTPDELQSLEDGSSIIRILHNAPAQTILWKSTVHLKTERNPLKSRNVMLTVNGVEGPWLLDTGANLSVVSRSFAERLGLKPLPGKARGQSGTTGIENTVQVALLSKLAIGGATLHDVVLVIMDDADLNVGPKGHKYQINAILGYPVLRALGRIAFSREGYFDAGFSRQQSVPGAPMYMDDLTPLIECSVDGQRLPFYLDTGASGTNLFPAYFKRFHESAKDWTKEKAHIFGAGGVVPREVFIQPRLTMRVGDKIVVLNNVKIYASEADSPAEYIFGNLGQDLLTAYDSFSLDFDAMMFRLDMSSEPIPDKSDTR